LIGALLFTLDLGAGFKNGLRTTSQGVNQEEEDMEERLLSTGVEVGRTEVQHTEPAQEAVVFNPTVILVYPDGVTSLPGTERSEQRLIGRDVVARTIVLEGNHNQIRNNSKIEYDGSGYSYVGDRIVTALGTEGIPVFVQDPYRAIWVMEAETENWLPQVQLIAPGTSSALLPTKEEESRVVTHSLLDDKGPLVAMPMLLHSVLGERASISIGSLGRAWRRMASDELKPHGQIVSLPLDAGLSIHVRAYRPVPDLRLTVRNPGGGQLVSMLLNEALPAEDDLIALRGLPTGLVTVELSVSYAMSQRVCAQEVELVSGETQIVHLDVVEGVNRTRSAIALELQLPDDLSLMETQLGKHLSMSVIPSWQATLNGAQRIRVLPLRDLIQLQEDESAYEARFNDGLFQGQYDVFIQPLGRVGSFVVGPDDEAARKTIIVPPLSEMRIDVLGADSVLSRGWSWSVSSKQEDLTKTIACVFKQEDRRLWVYGVPGELTLTAFCYDFSTRRAMLRDFSVQLKEGSGSGTVELSIPTGCRVKFEQGDRAHPLLADEWKSVEVYDSNGNRYREILYQMEDRNPATNSSVVATFTCTHPGEYKLVLPATEDRPQVECLAVMSEALSECTLRAK
jgi:hypothetical protein